MTNDYEDITIIDVRDPLKPLQINLIRILGAYRGVSTLEKDGKCYLYVTAGKNGLKIVEVSDPKNPVIVRTIRFNIYII